MINHYPSLTLKPGAELIPIAPREPGLEIASTFSALPAVRSIAFPRATGELAKGELTWEKLDRVSAALPNLLTMMFNVGD